MYEPSPAPETYMPRMFQTRARIGRVRYLAYCTVLTFLSAICLLILEAMAGDSKGALFAVRCLSVFASLSLTIIMAARRLHDLGHKSWPGVLLIVPFVNLLVALWLLFARGNPGPNEYGPAPAPNSWGVIVLACALPALLVAGIVMATVAGPEKSKFERARDEMEQAI